LTAAYSRQRSLMPSANQANPTNGSLEGFIRMIREIRGRESWAAVGPKGKGEITR
jgi:hypothetical protein